MIREHQVSVGTWKGFCHVSRGPFCSLVLVSGGSSWKGNIACWKCYSQILYGGSAKSFIRFWLFCIDSVANVHFLMYLLQNRLAWFESVFRLYYLFVFPLKTSFSGNSIQSQGHFQIFFFYSLNEPSNLYTNYHLYRLSQ